MPVTRPSPPTQKSEGVDSGDFAAEVEAATEELCAILNDLVVQVPGRPRKPRELATALHLDRSLAWKLARLLDGSPPLVRVRHLPGVQGLRIILNALESTGCPSEEIDRAQNCAGEFDDLVRRHAGSRATFQAMLRSLSAESGADTATTLRRDAFRSAAAAWGIQAGAQLSTRILKPSSKDPGKLDVVSVSGLVDLRRLRSDVPWVVARAGVTQDAACQSAGPARLPLASASSEHSYGPIHLMEAHCSRPIPPLRYKQLRNGFVELELVEGAVGQTAASTIIIGDVARAVVGRWRTEEVEQGHFATHIATPSEWLIQDVVLHESFLPRGEPLAACYAELGGCPWTPAESRAPIDRLAVRTAPLSSSNISLEAAPCLQPILLDALKAVGWERPEFRLFRVVYAYPLLGSVVVMSIPLPDQS